MGKSKHLSAVITLKDNMSPGIKSIRQNQREFQKELKKTKAEMRRTFNEKMNLKLEASSAYRHIQSIQTKLSFFKRKSIKVIAVKDLVSDHIKGIKRKLKSLASMVVSPVVKVKDGLSGGRKGKKGLLSALNPGVALGAASVGGIAATLKSGMTLEQQKISMEHFMGVGNKGKSKSQIKSMSADYVKSLRDNANATPFETGDVMAVGARALQISGGNSKEAMKQVKLAEDMAAMNPGKTISDAMEALADAQQGEMERLKEFGVKASKKDSYSDVQKTLQDKYSGGAEKLSDSGAGKISTIIGKAKSGIADIGEQAMEPLKPVLDDIISGMDTVMPKIGSVASAISSGIGGAIEFIKGLMPTIQPAIDAFKETISALAPVVGSAIEALKPIFTGLLSVASTVFVGICNVVQTVAPVIGSLISGVSTVISGVGHALKSMGDMFSSVFGAVKKVVKSAYDYIAPIVEKIKDAVKWVADGVSSVTNFFTGGGDTDHNATGTSYFSGGLTTVGEHGPELMQLPSGSKIFSNQELRKFQSQANNNIGKDIVEKSKIIKINKIADTINIDKDVDPHELFQKFVYYLKQVELNAV